MCIRDSVDAALPVSEQNNAAATREVYDVGIARMQPFGLSPVSYTHLRAHETVLDLVCRLLLEKKNHHLNKRFLTLTTITQPY